MSDEEKGASRAAAVDHHHPPYPPQPQPQYGTFQGVANYPPPQPPVIGFPQPSAPPGAAEPSAHPPHQYYPHGYQTVTGRPVRERRLPCCGIGVGWFLFIIGFFLGAIPWYVGVFVMLCARVDPREKPGYIACTIAAVLATIAIVFGVTKGADDW